MELHCHLLGTLRPSTAADLARANGVVLPIAPADLYPRIESPPIVGEAYRATVIPLPDAAPSENPEEPNGPTVGLLPASEWLAQTLVTPDDFARVAYEAQEDAARDSHVVYRELFFEAGWFLAQGLAYADVVDGLVAGLRAAETDFGITGRLVAGIDRQISAGAAREVVEAVVAHPRPEVLGIGLEGSELLGPPERFTEAYALAARSGLHRTAHAGEHVPTAAYALACLDVLGCERLDHGYFLLEDPEAVARCRDQQVIFVGAFTTSRRSWIPWRRASVRAMVDAGLRVTLGSDDPAMFPTTLTGEYLQAHADIGLSLDRVTTMVADSIEASWMPEGDKAARRRQLADHVATVTPVVNTL